MRGAINALTDAVSRPAGGGCEPPRRRRIGTQPASFDPVSCACTQPLVRWLLIGAGTLALGPGVPGLIVPGLPTPPFVLIAAACYLRSSECLYRWLIGNRVFGPSITHLVEEFWGVHARLPRLTWG